MEWEYKSVLFEKRKFFSGKVDQIEFSEMLNSYGDNGWEIVSIAQVGWSTATAMMTVLKKPK